MTSYPSVVEPSQEKPRPSRPFSSKKRWRMLIIAYTLLVMDICALSTLAPRLTDSRVTGGLDGCLVGQTNEPIRAVVTVSGAAKLTGEDGCFFFPSLQPGIHNLTISLPDQREIRRAVRIVRGKATALGIISIAP